MLSKGRPDCFGNLVDDHLPSADSNSRKWNWKPPVLTATVTLTRHNKQKEYRAVVQATYSAATDSNSLYTHSLSIYITEDNKDIPESSLWEVLTQDELEHTQFVKWKNSGIWGGHTPDLTTCGILTHVTLFAPACYGPGIIYTCLLPSSPTSSIPMWDWMWLVKPLHYIIHEKKVVHFINILHILTEGNAAGIVKHFLVMDSCSNVTVGE